MGWIDSALQSSFNKREDKKNAKDENFAKQVIEKGAEFGADRATDFATFGASIFIRPFFAPLMKFFGAGEFVTDIAMVTLLWGFIVFVCFYSTFLLPGMLANAGVDTAVNMWNNLNDEGIVNSRIIPCNGANERLNAVTNCGRLLTLHTTSASTSVEP